MKLHEKQIYPLYSFVFYQRRIGEAARNEKANEIIKHLKGLSADSPFYIDKGACKMTEIMELSKLLRFWKMASQKHLFTPMPDSVV